MPYVLIVHEVMGRNCGWLTAETARRYHAWVGEQDYLVGFGNDPRCWDVHAVYVPEMHVDLDAEAVGQAIDNAAAHGLTNAVFAVGDAWQPSLARVTAGVPDLYAEAAEGGVDLLMSNGLNIYVADDEDVLALYRAFRGLVRPGGTLVVSALTTPAEWDLAHVPLEVSRRSLGLALINDVQWANYRPVATTVAQLAAAGFDVLDIRYDSGRVFPTFVAC